MKELTFVLRLTFAIVHATLLTILHLAITLLFPSFSHVFFGLIGCILLPVLSFAFACMCNTFMMLTYTKPTLQRVARDAWIPPVGIFLCNSLIYPLEMFRSSFGPVHILAMTSITLGMIVSFILQLSIGKRLFAEDGVIDSAAHASEGTPDTSGALGPI